MLESKPPGIASWKLIEADKQRGDSKYRKRPVLRRLSAFTN